MPRDNTVTESTMDVFRASGIVTTVLSNGNVRTRDDATALGGAATIGGASVLVSNAALSGAIREAVAAESPAPWQARIATVNAHVSLLAAKDPARPIAVVLDRAGAATNNCLSETLASLAASPSFAPAPLDNALNARPATNYTIVDTQENEKRLSSVRALFGDEAQAQMFATAIDKPVLITGSQRLSLLALLANSWAESPDWSDRVDTQRTTTTKLVQSVEIVPASTVNLVNREGSIPVTVRNRSVYPVTISVMATPSNSRLEVDNPRFQPTRIDKDTQDQALVPVKAQLGNGEVTLRLALLSPTMTPIGAAVSVPINVRAEWETVGTVVVGALVVVFFGFGVTRNIRKRRRLRSTRSPSGTAREVTD